MREYYLNLAGLRTTLRTPYEITISENLRPFMSQTQQDTDCTIQLQSCVQLPHRSPNGVWHGLEYYDRCEGALRIFHCEGANTNAFAVTQLLEQGRIEICVLPEYLSYFTGTSGIFNRIGMETLLLQHKGLLLHASLIKYEGKAIAFSGPSGVGKSTQADIWKEYFFAEIINGDRAVLRKTSDGWYAYGSPYAGTSGIYKNDSAPLQGIVLLEQAKENSLRRLTAGEAFRQLYSQLSIHQWEKEFVAEATDLLLQLVENTPVYLLRCRPEKAAAELVKKGFGL